MPFDATGTAMTAGITHDKSLNKLIQDLRELRERLQSSSNNNVYNDKTIREIQGELQATLGAVSNHLLQSAEKERVGRAP